MRLEETLVSLLAVDDLRPAVRALCACARRQLPRAELIDPFNVTIVATAEAWAAGACTTARVRDIARQAQNTRGGFFTSSCVGVIAGPITRRTEIVRQFARQLPVAVWSASEAGRRWAAKAGPLAQVGRDPEALAEIATVEAELCSLAGRAKLG